MEIPDRNDPAFWDWMGEAQKEHHQAVATLPNARPIGTVVKAIIEGYVDGNSTNEILKMALGTDSRFAISTNPKFASIGGVRVVVSSIPTYEFEGYLRLDDFDMIMGESRFGVTRADSRIV